MSLHELQGRRTQRHLVRLADRLDARRALEPAAIGGPVVEGTGSGARAEREQSGVVKTAQHKPDAAPLAFGQ